MQVTLSPLFNGWQGFTPAGLPLSGGSIATYVAGTTTPLATYTSSAGDIANSNPIHLGTDGRPPSEIWLAAGSAYKFMLSDSSMSLIGTYDNIGLSDAGSILYSSAVSYPAGTVGGWLEGLALSPGSSFIGFSQSGAGAVLRTVQQELQSRAVTPLQFGAVGDGTTDDAAAFTAMFTTGKPWYIPYTTNGYKCSVKQVIIANGICDGLLIAPAGFVGHLVEVCNSVYSTKITIIGLNVYSTDVRPSPYGAAATLGIYVGPTSTFAGNTPCPGVNLIGCRSTRFSVGCWISTFNVTCISCEFPQNDHNCLVYTFDTNFNQVNDVSLINCTLDSAATSVGNTAYALRVGTVGNNTYASSTAMGVNMMVQGCNMDGAPVYIDNILGVVYQQNYHEQPNGYTYLGAALVLGSAGVASGANVLVQNCWFTLFDYAIDVVTQTNNLEVRPNFYASIKYSALRYYTTEAGQLRYWSGTAGGSTNWAINSGAPEVLTNFGGGVAQSQLDFGGISISGDFLNLGSQVAPKTTSTTNWYPFALTNDGYRNLSSTVGRFRSGAAIQTSIAGTMSGTNFTFTTLAQAKLFNGGDRITGTGGASGAGFIQSINYATGVAVITGASSGAGTITSNSAYFVGFNISGSGTPQSVVTANPASLYLNIAGGTSTTLYVKESGTGNTGWVAK